MKNKTKEQIETERNRIIAKMEEKYGENRIEIINTIYPDFENLTVKNKSVYCLGWAIQKLSEADVFVCWRDELLTGYFGCQIEKQVAKSYKIPIYVLTD